MNIRFDRVGEKTWRFTGNCRFAGDTEDRWADLIDRGGFLDGRPCFEVRRSDGVAMGGEMRLHTAQRYAERFVLGML